MSDDLLVGAFMATLFWAFFCFCLKIGIDDSWQHQIEQHGCAHYYLDANKDRQWDWIQR